MDRVRGLRPLLTIPVEAMVKHHSEFSEVHGIVGVHMTARHDGVYGRVHHVVDAWWLNAS